MFDIINKTIYEIDNWNQLVGLSSNLSPDLKIAVNTYNNDIIECTTIIIYMESIAAPLTSFIVSGTDAKLVKSSTVSVSIHSAIEVLNAFGFPVQWVSKLPALNVHTTQLLQDALSMGFPYVIRQQQNQVVFYSTDKKSRTILANELPIFNKCDFSEFELYKFYSIELLLKEAPKEDQSGINIVFDGGTVEGDLFT